MERCEKSQLHKQLYENTERRITEVEVQIREIQEIIYQEYNILIGMMAEGNIKLEREVDDAIRVKELKKKLMIQLEFLEKDIQEIKKSMDELE